MNRAKRLQMVGCVWAIALCVAGCWSFFWTPVIRKNMAQQRREDQAKKDELDRKAVERARAKQYFEGMSRAVRQTPPDKTWHLEPGQITPWIDMRAVKESNKSFSWHTNGHVREYLDWSDDRHEVLDCSRENCSLQGVPRRMRFENIDTKPQDLKMWYF